MPPADPPEAHSIADKLHSAVRSAFESPDWYFNKLNYRVLLRKRVVGQLTANISFARFLDIGCGDGSISLPLLQPTRHLTLQDLSEAMLQRARTLIAPEFKDNVDTIIGDFLQCDFSGRTFDLVICLGVLSYVEKLDAFLAKAASLLAPGGHLIIECTDGAHFISKILTAYSATTARLRKRTVSIGLQAHASADVLSGCQRLGLVLRDSYRYSPPPPLLRQLFTQRFHCNVNRFLHGGTTNRLGCLGTECIFHFEKRISTGSGRLQES